MAGDVCEFVFIQFGQQCATTIVIITTITLVDFHDDDDDDGGCDGGGGSARTQTSASPQIRRTSSAEEATFASKFEPFHSIWPASRRPTMDSRVCVLKSAAAAAATTNKTKKEKKFALLRDIFLLSPILPSPLAS